LSELKTERLVLRPTRQDDLHALHRIYSNPDAMRYWSSEPHSDVAITKAVIDSAIQSNANQLSLFGHAFELCFELDGDVIGRGGLFREDEIGYMFHPDYWGKGLGLEAVSFLTANIFAFTNLEKLTADVDPRNMGYRALLAKIGFVETHRAEKTFFLNGEYADSIYLRLDRPKLGSA